VAPAIKFNSKIVYLKQRRKSNFNRLAKNLALLSKLSTAFKIQHLELGRKCQLLAFMFRVGRPTSTERNQKLAYINKMLYSAAKSNRGIQPAQTKPRK